MQQPAPAPPTPLTEIVALGVSGVFIAGGLLLLYLGKIDFDRAITIFVFAVGILAANIALKAPSPTQQAQITAIVNQVMAFIPGLVARMQQPTPTPQVTVHNYIPPSATVPAVPIAAAAQPTPVQITPQTAFSATTSITPQMANAMTVPGGSWNALNQPLPAQVPQQEFPPATTFPSRFGDTGAVPVPPTAVSGQYPR